MLLLSLGLTSPPPLAWALPNKPLPSPQAIEKEMIGLVRRIGGEAAAVDRSTPSYFLSLVFPNYTSQTALIPTVVKGSHAIEARIDLLESHDKAFIAEQLSALRRCSDLPIVYTVRSLGQAGKFPEDEDRIFDLVNYGIRLGCEYVDMETCWSQVNRDKVPQLLLKGTGKGGKGSIRGGCFKPPQGQHRF